MDELFNLIGNAASARGSCKPTSCGTCATDVPKSESRAALSRRDLGRAALAASVSTLLAGCAGKEATERTAPAPAAAPALSQDLAVVQQSKGPIMTTLEEFYKMGPGPSSSHTRVPMRITYDFFQRVTKLPEDQLKRATALKVHLFGSLSATGKGRRKTAWCGSRDGNSYRPGHQWGPWASASPTPNWIRSIWCCSTSRVGTRAVIDSSRE
jgi:Serine dehydratase beta chain